MEGTVGHLVMASGPGLRDGRQLCIGIDVTGTGAVLQLADVVRQPLHGLCMSLGLECTPMAAAAAGPVGCELPRRLVRVGGVATGATRGAAMLARKFRRCMRKGHRRPVWVAMARGTVQGRRHVIGDFPHGRSAVVATVAIGRDSRVIEARRAPGQGAVARTALLRGRYVIARQRRGLHARVTTAAGVGSAGYQIRVFHPNRGELVGRMAGAAIVVAGYVPHVLAHGRHTVMAAEAGASRR